MKRPALVAFGGVVLAFALILAVRHAAISGPRPILTRPLHPRVLKSDHPAVRALESARARGSFSPEERSAVQSAGAELAWHLESALTERSAPVAWRREVLERIASNPDEATDQVVGATLVDLSEAPELRLAAAELLAVRPGKSATEALAAVFERDPAFPDRELLLKSLGRTGNEAAASVLLSVLENPRQEDRFRRTAAEGLGGYGKLARVIEASRSAAASDPSMTVRLAAVGALARAGGPLAEAALESVGKGEGEAATKAREALEKLRRR